MQEGGARQRQPSSGQSEVEGGALVDGGFGPDAAAVAEDDALDDGEADAGAFVLFGSVHPLEDAEEASGVLHLEASAVVAHKINKLLVLEPANNLHDGVLAAA